MIKSELNRSVDLNFVKKIIKQLYKIVMRKIHSLPLFFVSVFTSLLQLHLGTLQSLMRCSLETVQDFLVQVGHKHFFDIISFHYQTY